MVSNSDEARKLAKEAKDALENTGYSSNRETAIAYALLAIEKRLEGISRILEHK